MARLEDDRRLIEAAGLDRDVIQPRDWRSGDDIAATAIERFRRALLDSDEIRDLRMPESLVEGLLFANTLTALFGPFASFKSFMLVDWAASIATGTPWGGRQVQGGTVLYVAAEGAEGYGPRLAAWEQHHCRRVPPAAIRWLPLAAQFSDVEQRAALRVVAEELAPDLIVVDTLARCAVGLEENSAKDMGVLVHAADELRRATGACVILAHHSGKSERAGMRGSSALAGAVDVAIRAEPGPSEVTLHSEKSKHWRPFDPIRLIARPALESLVLELGQDREPDCELSPATAEVLAAIVDLDLGTGVSNSVWKAACAGVAPRTFARAVKRLIAAGLVDRRGTERATRYSATDLGKQQRRCHGATSLPVGATEAGQSVPSVPHPVRGGTVASTVAPKDDQEPPPVVGAGAPARSQPGARGSARISAPASVRNAPRCSVCNKPMLLGQVDRHYECGGSVAGDIENRGTASPSAGSVDAEVADSGYIETLLGDVQ
jgi:DNA-binding MarR family transcriptional regulator